MTNVSEISIETYDYTLPNNRIALHPLPARDASKLLIYKEDTISEATYKSIADFIPADSLMIFNDTKVINARLLFTKETGGTIEVFILEPYGIDISSAMVQEKNIQVKCFIGGASKWKQGAVLHKELQIANSTCALSAVIIKKETDAYIVGLEWNSDASFLTLLDAAGQIPLPPYIKRSIAIEDTNRYQTIYAVQNGSVAAPTAGLHFTPYIMNTLAAKNVQTTFVTLHVGAGTFKPVTSTTMATHVMHAEYISVDKAVIVQLLQNTHPVIAVGTTSVRTIESLYWLGVKTKQQPDIALTALHIQQWEAYQLLTTSVQDALQALLEWMERNNINTLQTTTQLLIAPGYTYKIVDAIVTNFHQPKSTLLLLVAAATNGKWKSLYDYALENDFRFLSYGDGCLIFIKKS